MTVADAVRGAKRLSQAVQNANAALMPGVLRIEECHEESDVDEDQRRSLLAILSGPAVTRCHGLCIVDVVAAAPSGCQL